MHGLAIQVSGKSVCLECVSPWVFSLDWPKKLISNKKVNLQKYLI